MECSIPPAGSILFRVPIICKSKHTAGFLLSWEHDLSDLLKHLSLQELSRNEPMNSPIFIIGPHRAGSTLWHNLISMCPGIMRLTDPRFLSDGRHKDFRHFITTAVGDLSLDAQVDKMVEICFAR